LSGGLHHVANTLFTVIAMTRHGDVEEVNMPVWTKAPTSLHKARVIQLFLIIMAMFSGNAAAAGSLQGAVLADNELVLTFDGPVGDAASLALDGPQRIAIDIAGAQPGVPVLASGNGVLRVRQGQGEGDVTRFVLDLDQPMTIRAVRHAADGRSLSIALAPAADSQFLAAVRAGLRSFASPVAGAPTLAMARRENRRYQVSVPIGTARRGLPLPRIYGPTDRALPLVVIDAGHGGHDPGAINTAHNAREEEITLAIARRTRDALVASGRVRVALTRDDDRFLVLEERYGLARRMNADLFISIHADAAENPEASGASIYTLSEVASDREASRLAARENRANILNGVDLGGTTGDVGSILIDLTQRETMNLSSDFARTLQRTGGADIPFRNAPHRFAGFVVLKAPDMPSVLIETGFLTNTADAARITSVAGQQSIARGIRQGVLTHFARQIAAAEARSGQDRTAVAAR
jgi:N-acetylmuramoyl-L-alanine amidase